MAKRERFWHRHPRWVRAFLLLTTFFVAFGGGFAYGAWALACRGGRCPSIDALEDYSPRQTSKLFAADNRFIAEIGMERRTLISLSEIPQVVRDAFVMTEDKRFYRHAGIDWMRVFGAGIRNVQAGTYAQGFSTITMQLARNVFPESLTREKTLMRKLTEAKVARAIEARYTKEKILELYLNQIDLGNRSHGVETAAQSYFGKSARNLTAAEAATLAALPKAPARYNPRRFPDRAIDRRNTVIELMRRGGAISDADASLARAYPLNLAPPSQSGDVAPYYVEWVRRQLDERFGRQLYEQGLQVYTTLDLEMQSAAERAMERQMKAIEAGNYGAFRHTTFEQHMAKRAAGDESTAPNSPYLQGAFVALEANTGAVRAMVGGRSFDDSKFNRATQALRQAGSTFKPIVYSDAIRNGRAASQVISDSPVEVPQLDGSIWRPRNYDGTYEGGMTIRNALLKSRNIPAIRVGMDLGEASVIRMARQMGISSDIPPYPSMHIGAADVYPIELIAAFTTFANLGVRTEPFAIIRVENNRGEVLWEPQPQHVSVLSPEEAWLMVDMLRDIVRRPGGTGYGSVWARGGFRHPAGGKTGTTNDGNDVWFIGFTSDLVAGAWIGLDRPQNIKRDAQGGTLAAPIWAAFMTEVYQRRPAPRDWPRPEGIRSVSVDVSTGLLDNPFCPRELVYSEYFIAGTEPYRECDVHSPFTLFPVDTMGLIPTPLPGDANRVVPGGAPVPRPTVPDSNPFRLPPPPRTTPPPTVVPPPGTTTPPPTTTIPPPATQPPATQPPPTTIPPPAEAPPSTT